MKVPRWEINHAIDLLEREGYLVRKPSEVTLPVTLEVLPFQRNHYEVSLRADAILNGKTCALSQSFPFEMLLNPDDDGFRKRDLPVILSRHLARYMADSLLPELTAQIEAKIIPLVPEKRMSLTEIEAYLAWALRDCRAEKEQGTNA